VDEAWLVERLTSEGLVTPERLAAARTRQLAEGGELAGHLFAAGAIDEASLLRVISIAHRTSYVTIDKLAKARIPAEVLERLPADVAAAHHVVPLQFDATTRTLSVVASDPTDDVIEAARLATDATTVRAYIALPQAIDAAIRRFYLGDVAAFVVLEAMVAAYEAPTNPVMPQPQARRPSRPAITPLPLDHGLTPTPSPVPAPPPASTHPARRNSTTVGVPITLRPTGPMPIPTGNALPAELDAHVELSRPEATRRATPPPPVSLAPEAFDVEVPPRGTQELRRATAPVEVPGVGMEAYLETLKVLVSLAEMGSASWRQGHAAEVVRQAHRVGLRIGLPERELAELSIAAYLHDVGKPDEPHLTLLGLQVAPDQRAIAEKVHATPARLFGSASLPEGTLAALAALYERIDGQGLPRRRRGREVPLGARVLALVDAYVDLTANPFGAAGGNVADPEAALATLRRHKDTLFDANLVDILQQVISGDDLRHRLLGDRARVLLADTDAEATTMIELKLVAEGYEVRSARSSTEALRAMSQWLPDLVVSEVKLEPGDGFALLEEARRHQRTHEIPFFFLSERHGAVELDRGFALGATDYLTKPVALDVLLVKVKRLVAERARARDAAPGRRVVGSLAEMPVPDVVEVLAKGRKTGALRLSPSAQGHTMPSRGDVWLDGGKIVHATCLPTLAGQEALFRLLRLREGEFAFEAGVPAPARSIDAPTEWLLLEALRRIDES
jgi:response regulator RpfG family c-di-GMP phosphodiesterase